MCSALGWFHPYSLISGSDSGYVTVWNLMGVIQNAHLTEVSGQFLLQKLGYAAGACSSQGSAHCGGRTRACRGCHKDAQPFFFFLLRQPLSDVWWLPTNRHRLPTNRHRLHTNRHQLHTNRHRLPTNRHQLPTGRHHRAYWTLRVFFYILLWQPLRACQALALSRRP